MEKDEVNEILAKYEKLKQHRSQATKKYATNNPEKMRAISSKYYYQNRDKVLEKKRIWYLQKKIQELTP